MRRGPDERMYDRGFEDGEAKWRPRALKAEEALREIEKLLVDGWANERELWDSSFLRKSIDLARSALSPVQGEE